MIGDKKLNHCKFCGSSAHIRGWLDLDDGHSYQVTCSNIANCVNETKWFSDKGKAIDAWNVENSEETKPCPFCGTPFNESNVSTSWIEVDYVAGYDCSGCYCQMISNGRLTKEEAIADLQMRWNTRS